MQTATLTFACALLMGGDLQSDDYFAITVIDEATRRGVPLVELRTVNDLVYYTDSNGTAAFFEPGLMDRDVFFYVASHGYEFAKDGFGFRGKRLRTTPGTEAVLEISRVNIAERLYRVTGSGIDVDSKLVQKAARPARPLLNAEVVGSDSVQNYLFQDRIYWFWGDTTRPSYPLGNFNVPGATSKLPGDGGLDPLQGVDLEYFLDDDGFAKSTCAMPGEGPTWVDGLVVIADADGQQRMFAYYLKIKPPLTVYQHGLAEFNPEKNEFERVCIFPEGAPFYPNGHAFVQSVEGKDYVYFARPFPIVRVPATPGALRDLNQYQAFTCLAEGTSADDRTVDRDANGIVRYGWKPATAPLTGELQQKLIRSGKLESQESVWKFCDVETGKPIQTHHGSMYWNPFRTRWVTIMSEFGGSSVLGEVWYAEASSPEGPWAYARKIVTHDRQSFYNPKHHPLFDQDGGRTIFFEGTYTNSFSGNDERTPRYNYNQIMYRLDLADPRLVLPVPVYRGNQRNGDSLSLAPPASDPTFSRVAFYACDRPFPGSIAIHGDVIEGSVRLAASTTESRHKPVRFFALDVNDREHPSTSTPLYEHTDESGRKKYLTGNQEVSGYRRADAPLCRVWKNPALEKHQDNERQESDRQEDD